MVGVQTQRLLSGLDCSLGLSNARILVRQVVEGNPIVWVAVSPQSVGFDSFIVFIGYVYVVVGCDIELLTFADMLAPLKGLARVFICKIDLGKVSVDRA